jgi:hypothetical protein
VNSRKEIEEAVAVYVQVLPRGWSVDVLHGCIRREKSKWYREEMRGKIGKYEGQVERGGWRKKVSRT